MSIFTIVTIVSTPFWATLIGAPHSVLAMRIAAFWGGTGAITFIGLGLLRSTERYSPYLIAALAQSIIAQSIGLAATITVRHTATTYLAGVSVGQVLALAVVLVTLRPSLIHAFEFWSLETDIGVLPTPCAAAAFGLHPLGR